MGCVTSCFRPNDEDEDDDDGHQNPEHPAIRFLTLPQQLYTVLFQRRQLHAATPSVQRATSSGSVAEDSSIPDSYHAPPRPLPYDDPRCSRSHCQREGLVSRGGKASHFHREFEALQGINVHTGPTYKLNGSEGQSKTSLKFQSKEVTTEVTYIFSSSDDEDCCPTCFEEYTSENPRIIMQCSHHYHLGCIYDWMERSEACPVCGKVMLFNETS